MRDKSMEQWNNRFKLLILLNNMVLQSCYNVLQAATGIFPSRACNKGFYKTLFTFYKPYGSHDSKEVKIQISSH